MLTADFFYNRLKNEIYFKDETFDLSDQILHINHFGSNYINFENCTFNCDILNFSKIQNEDLMLKFQNCTFNCAVRFFDCNFKHLNFQNTEVIESLSLGNPMSTLRLDIFQFSYDLKNPPELACDFNIQNTNIEIFLFQKVKHIKGKFRFSRSTISENKKITTFENSTITNVLFTDNSFFAYSIFRNVKFNFTSEHTGFTVPSGFYRNIFSKVSFSESTFIGKFQFENCDFQNVTFFEKCISELELIISSCEFSKYSLFDNSKFKKTHILHSKFFEKVSFENFETNFFKIHQVTFAGAAYFDDLNKNNNKSIENWDRKTLRSIKRELVNTHNQIDYLRFKAYEMKAYKKEVDQSNLRWRDSLILYLNEESNGFGLDWTKGITFILKWSVFFYLHYIAWYSFYLKDSNPTPVIDNFLVNYLKFLNPFSFLKAPIEDSENYFFPFFFFLLGKIFVSYGIFQTVQAFRKFGVNGG